MESKSLNLWKRQFGTLPGLPVGHAALETLVLADNALTELPVGIGALTSVRTLDLGHNLLMDLREALGLLTGLSDYLYLHDNQLTALKPCATCVCLAGLWRRPSVLR